MLIDIKGGHNMSLNIDKLVVDDTRKTYKKTKASAYDIYKDAVVKYSMQAYSTRDIVSKLNNVISQTTVREIQHRYLAEHPQVSFPKSMSAKRREYTPIVLRLYNEEHLNANQIWNQLDKSVGLNTVYNIIKDIESSPVNPINITEPEPDHNVDNYYVSQDDTPEPNFWKRLKYAFTGNLDN